MNLSQYIRDIGAAHGAEASMWSGIADRILNRAGNVEDLEATAAEYVVSASEHYELAHLCFLLWSELAGTPIPGADDEIASYRRAILGGPCDVADSLYDPEYPTCDERCQSCSCRMACPESTY